MNRFTSLVLATICLAVQLTTISAQVSDAQSFIYIQAIVLLYIFKTQIVKYHSNSHFLSSRTVPGLTLRVQILSSLPTSRILLAQSTQHGMTIHKHAGNHAPLTTLILQFTHLMWMIQPSVCLPAH